MECLPFEVHRIIFSFLSLEEQINCREVCKTLKESVELNLRSVTHLQLFRKDVYYREFKMDTPTFAHDEFFIKPFHTISCDADEFMHSEMWSFLGNYCPNLQVVDAPIFSILFTDLQKVAKRLTYFCCRRVISGEEDKDKDPVSTGPPDDKWPGPALAHFEPFKNLLGFDTVDDSEFPREKRDELFSSIVFAENFRRQNKPIVTLTVDTRDKFSEILSMNWYESIVSCNFRCLKLRLAPSPSSIPSPIPESLAHNLIEMHFEFGVIDIRFYLSSQDFFCATFPNLKYLNIVIESYTAFNRLVLKTALNNVPQLRAFSYTGPIKFYDLESLFEQINNIESIISIKLRVDMKALNVLQVHLPPKVEVFSLRTGASFQFLAYQLMDSQLSSLRVLDTSFIVDSCLKASNLEKIALCIFESSFDLMETLPDLPKVKSMTLGIHEKLESLQSLVDSLSKLKTLQEIVLYSAEDMKDQDVIFKQQDFPSLKYSLFMLEAKYHFYPLDTFDKLEFNGGLLELSSPSCRICLRKTWVTIEGDPLTKIEKIYLIDSLSYSDALPLVKIVSEHSQVRNVELEVLNEDFEEEPAATPEEYGQLVEWLCSINSLETLIAPFDQDSLKHFLSNTKTSELSFLRARARFDDVPLELSDELHSLLNTFLDKNTTLFFSPFTCKCSLPCLVVRLQSDSDDEDGDRQIR